MYLIGDFSKITKLSLRTLRYYHEIQLLSPSFIDPRSGYRYYDENCIEKARIINKLKSLEFPLDDIKEILHSCTDDSDITSLMEKRLNDINNKLAKYSEMKTKVESFINLEKSVSRFETLDIALKEIPDILIAFSRFKGKYSEINSYMEKLYEVYGSLIISPPFSLYYDDNSIEENADIEVCVPISQAAAGDKTNTRVLNGCRVVSIIHQGSYESLYNSYKVLVDYIRKHNLTIIYPIREIYLKGRGLLFDGIQENYITEIQFPFK